MPDIGFGEILVIVVLGLLVFGPDRLPKVASDAARTLRHVRQMAASARQDLVDASGLEDDGEVAQTVRDLRDLDPRNVMKGPLTEDSAAGVTKGPGPTTLPDAPQASGTARGRGRAGGTGGRPAANRTTSTHGVAGGAGGAGGAAGVAGTDGAARPQRAGSGVTAEGAQVPADPPGERTAQPLPPSVDVAPADPDWT